MQGMPPRSRRNPPRRSLTALIAIAWNRRLAALVCALLALALAVGSASAHGYIIRSIPEDRAVLERAPTRVQYWFSEPLEARFSAIVVRDGSGASVAQGGVSADQPMLLEARLPSGLPDGVYLSELRIAFASDGHVITETRAFFVGEAAGIFEGGAASDVPVVLESIWRFGLSAGLLLTFGVFSLYALVLVPAWGGPQHPAGALPPRVMRRASAIAAAGLALAAAAHVLALVQQTMLFFNADLARVLTEGLLNTVRVSTRFGDVWNMRTLLLLAAAGLWGAAVYLRQSQPALVRPLWTANAWLLALALATLSLGSHAAGSLILPWAALANDWLHLAAIGVWVGGLAALALIVPAALSPLTGDARRLALLAALHRFSPVAAAALSVVIASGIFSALLWVTAPAEANTRYGITLGLKLVLVASLAGVAALHHIALRPERYQRMAGLAGRLGARQGTLALEAGLALAVLAAAALLSATPVPRPTLTGESIPAPTGSAQFGDLQLTMTIVPGGPGVNTFDVVLLQDGTPLDDGEVRVRAASPARDTRSPWATADAAGDGLFTASSAAIDQAGAWWAQIDVLHAGEHLRAVFPVDIRDEAAVVQQRPPNAAQALALAGVSVACTVVLLPLARRGWRSLDRRALPLTIAGLALAGGALVVALGIVLSQQAAQQFETRLQPPPTVVNTVPPDMESLARGAALFSARCLWPDQPAWIELTRRLSTLRDDALFDAVGRGWRGLPACSPPLSATDQWDIVNYLRTLEMETG